MIVAEVDSSASSMTLASEASFNAFWMRLWGESGTMTDQTPFCRRTWGGRGGGGDFGVVGESGESKSISDSRSSCMLLIIVNVSSDGRKDPFDACVTSKVVAKVVEGCCCLPCGP